LSDAIIAKISAPRGGGASTAVGSTTATAPGAGAGAGAGAASTVTTPPKSPLEKKDITAEPTRSSRYAQLKGAGLSDDMISRMLAAEDKKSSKGGASPSRPAVVSSAEIAGSDRASSASPTGSSPRDDRFAQLRAAGLSDAIIAKISAPRGGGASTAVGSTTATAPGAGAGAGAGAASTVTTPPKSPLEKKDITAEPTRSSRYAQLKGAGLSDDMISRMLAAEDKKSSKGGSSPSRPPAGKTGSYGRNRQINEPGEDASSIEELMVAGFSESVAIKMVGAKKKAQMAHSALSGGSDSSERSSAAMADMSSASDRHGLSTEASAVTSSRFVKSDHITGYETMEKNKNKKSHPFDSPELVERRSLLRSQGLSEYMIEEMIKQKGYSEAEKLSSNLEPESNMMSKYANDAAKEKHRKRLTAAGVSTPLIDEIVLSLSDEVSNDMKFTARLLQDADGEAATSAPPPEMSSVELETEVNGESDSKQQYSRSNARNTLAKAHLDKVTKGEHRGLTFKEAMSLDGNKKREPKGDSDSTLSKILKKLFW